MYTYAVFFWKHYWGQSAIDSTESLSSLFGEGAADLLREVTKCQRLNSVHSTSIAQFLLAHHVESIFQISIQNQY